VGKANRVLEMTERNFDNRYEETTMSVHKMVRPHLEYCSPVWKPYFLKKRYEVVGRSTEQGYMVN